MARLFLKTTSFHMHSTAVIPAWNL